MVQCSISTICTYVHLIYSVSYYFGSLWEWIVSRNILGKLRKDQEFYKIELWCPFWYAETNRWQWVCIFPYYQLLHLFPHALMFSTSATQIDACNFLFLIFFVNWSLSTLSAPHDRSRPFHSLFRFINLTFETMNIHRYYERKYRQ